MGAFLPRLFRRTWKTPLVLYVLRRLGRFAGATLDEADTLKLVRLVRVVPMREAVGLRFPTENCGALEDVHGDLESVFFGNC